MPHLSLNSPLGFLTLFEEEGRLVSLDWGRAPGGAPTPLLEEAKRQLDAYFDGKRRAFDLPLAPAGSPFQQSVWELIAAIPFGETRPYGDLARRLGSAPRAVGGACGRNPLPLLIPCHRVVGSGGSAGGYSGDGGLATKRWLLDWEGRVAGLPARE